MATKAMTLKEYYAAKKRVVRKLLEVGYGIPEIAEEFGVQRQSMWQFVRRHKLDDGLHIATKDQDEYYLVQRAQPALAAEEDVVVLKKLARNAGVKL